MFWTSFSWNGGWDEKAIVWEDSEGLLLEMSVKHAYVSVAMCQGRERNQAAHRGGSTRGSQLVSVVGDRGCLCPWFRVTLVPREMRKVLCSGHSL